MQPLTRSAIIPLIKAALREDRARHDLTSRAVLPPDTRIRARIIAKAPSILAGGPVAGWVFQALDPSLRCRLAAKEGSRLEPNQTILIVEGPPRSILTAERTALNLLGHLSGIATLTREYVRRTRGTRAKILDTRKTLPGLRALEKYAVRAGGGHNHRGNLSEAILIKTSHLNALGNGKRQTGNVVQRAIAQAKHAWPKHVVEVEVTGMAEFRAALIAQPDAILLDNWRLADIHRAVQRVPRSPFPVPLIEVSGGITLANVRAYAKTGVDRISIGRLTHSAPSLDVSLQVING